MIPSETAKYAAPNSRRAANPVRGLTDTRCCGCGLSSNNANAPGVFDGEAVPMPYMADTRIAEAAAALRRFVAEHGSIPTAESWTEAAMRPSEKTIRRRFGSFKVAVATPMIDPK